mmetsp:Transcript_22865/g.41080  ORF Transcript_22865/g.41080 Transcript_22865/m.41080 type:complete len:477 (-) Transcript_22865:983-2413(-)
MAHIDDYKVGRLLGAGNFSKVKLARHLPTGKLVAIKIVDKELVKRKHMFDKLRREIRILKLFRHPHVMRIFDSINTHDKYYLITEYLPGGDLYALLERRGRLSEAETRHFFQQTISGLEYCHWHRVAHRDIKPENILLDEQQNLKIADFGLANLMKDGEFCLTSCGSPNYAAPELISGNKYCGSEVDIWSTGVVLYALLAGCLPFDEPNISDLFTKIKAGVFKVPRHFSPSARDLVIRMLNVDPVGRITIEQIKNHPWYYHNLPNYISIGDLKMTNEALAVLRFDRNSKQIDEEVFVACRQLEKFSHRESDELKQQLGLQRDGSFSACYEILMTDKYKHVKEIVNSQQLPCPVFCKRKHTISLSAFATSTLEGEALEGCMTTTKLVADWKAGIKLSATVPQVIEALHSCLSEFNLFWKVQGNLHFRFKSKKSNLKFDAFLYGLEHDTVVDMELVDGHYIEFMSMCCAIRSILLMSS